jgi:Mitochondrial carrier protein
MYARILLFRDHSSRTVLGDCSLQERKLLPPDFALFALCGGLGCVATHSAVIPLDVVKTRMQTAPAGRYTGLGQVSLQHCVCVYKLRCSSTSASSQCTTRVTQVSCSKLSFVHAECVHAKHAQYCLRQTVAHMQTSMYTCLCKYIILLSAALMYSCTHSSMRMGVHVDSW